MHFTKWIGPKCVSLIIRNKKSSIKYHDISIKCVVHRNMNLKSIWSLIAHYILIWTYTIDAASFIFIVRLMPYLVSMIFHKSLPVQKKSSTICLVREMNTMRPYLTIQHSVTTWYWCKQHEYVNFSLNLYLSWCYLTW